MAHDLNASLTSEKNLLESGGMLNLYEVQVVASPATYEYWKEPNFNATYFIPKTNTPQQYTAIPISRGEVEQDDGTKVPSLTVNIGAVDQVITAYIENQDALRRNRVRHLTVPYDQLWNASAYLLVEYFIDGAAIDHDKEVAVFQLTSRGQVADVTVPLRRMRRDQCYKRYNATPDCLASRIGTSGYRTTISESTCRHTKDACASKDNVINFGGFPGVGTKKVFF